MTENKRFTIKPQDVYFGITDNNTADKVNVINGIRTKIEAIWLCDLLNELYGDLMDARAENTINKLVLKNIVEDLEKHAESKEPIIIGKDYVEWIKQNVVLGFAKERLDD